MLLIYHLIGKYPGSSAVIPETVIVPYESNIGLGQPTRTTRERHSAHATIIDESAILGPLAWL